MNYTRTNTRAPWQCDGVRVSCSGCGERITGRLLLRNVDRGPMFGLCREPLCVDCYVDEGVAERSIVDVGDGLEPSEAAKQEMPR